MSEREGVLYARECAEKLWRWQQDYNRVRPHSALEDRALATFVAEWVATTTPADQDAPELLETLT